MTVSSAAPTHPDTLPWPPLITLGVATLVMVTAEMLPTAVLVPMSHGLGVAESLTGQLVAAWALTVVVASLPLTHLTRRIDRRPLIVAALLALAVSSAVTAVAPSYAVVLGARLFGAVAVGLLWSTVNAHVSELVPDPLLARAFAVVLGGATLGMVLGTPLGRLVADRASWRAGFALLAVATVGVAILVRGVVPGRARHADVRSTVHVRREPLGPSLLMLALVGLLLVGYFGVYTFITPIGEPAAALLSGGMSSLLLGYGVASAVGVAVAGRLSRHTTTGLVAAAAATALGILSLVGADHAGVGLLTIIALGLVTGMWPPLAQTEVLRLAGSGHRDLVAALIPIVFNGGMAVGAAVASLIVSHAGYAALPVPAAATVGVAAIGLGVATASRKHTAAPVPQPATPSPAEQCAASS